MVKYKDQRVAVFVDVQNMYYSAKNLYGGFVNFGQILLTAQAGRPLVRAFAYVIKADLEQEKNFFDALEKQGFEIRVKDLQIFPGGMKKGDWDVGITVDAVILSEKVDAVVLVTGDGDFVPLVEYLKNNKGCRVEVMSFGKTASARLIEAADQFTDLESDLRRFMISARSKSRDNIHQRSEVAPDR